MEEIDQAFYDRADAHIHLSNDQLADVGRGKVSASMLYAAARYNAYVSACGWNSAEEMASAKEETLNYFITEFRAMLEVNLDDYIENFDTYMKPEK